MSSQPSFFASLFDFSFSRFVTIRFVKFLYVASMVLLVFGGIAAIVSVISLANSEGPAFEWLAAIVFAPVGAFFYLIMIRVLLELVVVVFRIGETATEIRDLLSKSASSS